MVWKPGPKNALTGIARTSSELSMPVRTFEDADVSNHIQHALVVIAYLSIDFSLLLSTLSSPSQSDLHSSLVAFPKLNYKNIKRLKHSLSQTPFPFRH